MEAAGIIYLKALQRGSKMPTRAISWAALLVALPGVAIAADLPNKKAPAPAPLMFSWDGLYVGTSVGYGFSTLNETGVDPLTPAFSGLAAGPVAYQQSYSPRGVQTGAHVGYLKQYGHFVLGGEADVDYATNNTSKTLFNGLGVVTNGPFQTSIQDNLRASLVGKAGYADGRSLYYVLGGLSIGDTQVRHNYWGMPSTYTSFGYSTPNPNNDINNIERFGWTVGAGLEYAFTDHWSASVEYRHSDFGTATVTSTGNQNSGIGPEHTGCWRHFRPDLQGARDGRQHPPRHQLPHRHAGNAGHGRRGAEGPDRPSARRRRRTRPSSAASITPIRTNGAWARRPTCRARRQAAALTSPRRRRRLAPIPSPNGPSAARTRLARRSPVRSTAH